MSSPTASKESSFIYAIISATLTHTITGACKDEIIDCESQTTTGITVNETHSVTSDLHDVTYSAILAEKFLDSIENGGKSLSDRQHLNLHNNRLGRMVTYNLLILIIEFELIQFAYAISCFLIMEFHTIRFQKTCMEPNYRSIIHCYQLFIHLLTCYERNASTCVIG